MAGLGSSAETSGGGGDTPWVAQVHREGRYSSFAQGYLAKLGWKAGDGLGKERKGDVTPVAQIKRTTQGGVGASGREDRLAWDDLWWENAYSSSASAIQARIAAANSSSDDDDDDDDNDELIEQEEVVNTITTTKTTTSNSSVMNDGTASVSALEEALRQAEKNASEANALLTAAKVKLESFTSKGKTSSIGKAAAKVAKASVRVNKTEKRLEKAQKKLSKAKKKERSSKGSSLFSNKTTVSSTVAGVSKTIMKRSRKSKASKTFLRGTGGGPATSFAAVGVVEARAVLRRRAAAQEAAEVAVKGTTSSGLSQTRGRMGSMGSIFVKGAVELE